MTLRYAHDAGSRIHLGGDGTVLPGEDETVVLVTMELFCIPPWRVPAAVTRMATDRRRLAGTAGLRFHKLLGTGDGRTFDLRDADLRTWGLLAVWEHEEAAAAFRQDSVVAGGWRRLATEAWRAELRLLGSRGLWSGHAPFGAPAVDGWSGPVAAITRARLRLGRMRAFWRAVPAVSADLAGVSGLRLAVGIGEAPFGLQGTFSLWRSADDLRTFAYRRAPHRQVIEDTPRQRWYAEELFARFAVDRTDGTIFGGDPLG